MVDTDASIGVSLPPWLIKLEEIELKPSTELIPDEFPIGSNKNVLVSFLLRRKDQSAQKLANKLEQLHFTVEKTEIASESEGESDDNCVDNFIQDVKNKVNLVDYAGVFLVFSKILYSDPDSITKIWSSFTTKECPQLKDKPKIFLIQSYTAVTLVKDSLRAEPSPYDSPSEADLLIILDTYSGRNDILDSFINQIDTHGITEDIVTLASLSLGSDGRPLIISTMTRKFYFERHNLRGHHYHINQIQNEIRESLKTIKNELQSQRKIKKKTVMDRGNMKNTASSSQKKSNYAGVTSAITCSSDSTTQLPKQYDFDSLQTRQNNPVAERGYMKSTKSSIQKLQKRRSLTNNTAGLGSSKSTASSVKPAPPKSSKKPLTKSSSLTTSKSTVTSLQSKSKQ